MMTTSDLRAQLAAAETRLQLISQKRCGSLRFACRKKKNDEMRSLSNRISLLKSELARSDRDMVLLDISEARRRGFADDDDSKGVTAQDVMVLNQSHRTPLERWVPLAILIVFLIFVAVVIIRKRRESSRYI